MTFHFNEEEKIIKKTCKILTEKEYEYIKNCIQNIAVNVKEYGLILSEQINLISDINTVLLMQHKAHENLIAQNDKITKKCVYLTEQLAEKNKVIDNLMEQIEEMKSASRSGGEWGKW